MLIPLETLETLEMLETLNWKTPLDWTQFTRPCRLTTTLELWDACAVHDWSTVVKQCCGVLVPADLLITARTVSTVLCPFPIRVANSSGTFPVVR